MVILNIRVLAIVLLATTAVACTIGSLPPQPGQDAATALAGAGGNNTGASVDAANVGTRIEAGTNSGGAGTMGGTGGAAVGGTAIGGSIATGGATISADHDNRRDNSGRRDDQCRRDQWWRRW